MTKIPNLLGEKQARASLKERHTDHTRQWIVDSAAELLEQSGLADLTNAAVAQRAGVSERTVYRHFSTREALLDELTIAVGRKLDTPAMPGTPEALLDYPALLFARFEAYPELTRAALAPEVFLRIRDGRAAQRRQAVQRMLAQYLPDMSPEQITMNSANIHYLLTASTWNYYRQHFNFDADQTVLCVQQALRLLMQSLGVLPAKS